MNNKKVVHVGDKNNTGAVPKSPAQLLVAQYGNQFGELQKAYHQFVTINKSPIPHYEQFRHCRKRGKR